jgi:HAD superfamily hydrolase (TIGR01509 family)
MAERKNNYYVESLNAVTPDDLLPGARELVEECKRRGLRVAIGSSSRNAQLVLQQLQITDMFDDVTDGYDAERSKPAPDLFLHAAEQVDVPPARCIVLEDAAAGVDAANSAGMLSVGIGPRDRLPDADLIYDTVDDVDIDEMLSTANPRA